MSKLNYNYLTVPVLKSTLKALGYRGYSRARKAQLVSTLRRHGRRQQQVGGAIPFVYMSLEDLGWPVSQTFNPNAVVLNAVWQQVVGMMTNQIPRGPIVIGGQQRPLLWAMHWLYQSRTGHQFQG